MVVKVSIEASKLTHPLIHGPFSVLDSRVLRIGQRKSSPHHITRSIDSLLLRCWSFVLALLLTHTRRYVGMS